MAPQALQQRALIPILPGPGDIFSDLTSGIGQITSKIGDGVSSIFDPPTETSSSIPASATSSSDLSSVSLSTSSSLPATSSTSDVITPSSSTPTPTPSSVAPSTVTDRITRTANVSVETSAAPAAPKGFLQNKALSGFVFALVGLIGLILIFSAVTFAIRRQRRNKLMQEAVSFEPASSRMYLDDMDDEKQRTSSGHGSEGEGGYGYGQYPMPPAPSALYYEPQAQMGHGSAAAYPSYVHPSQMGNDAYDGVISSDNYQFPATQNMSRRVPPPSLPDTFGDRSSPAPAGGPPVPLKITNE